MSTTLIHVLQAADRSQIRRKDRHPATWRLGEASVTASVRAAIRSGYLAAPGLSTRAVLTPRGRHKLERETAR